MNDERKAERADVQEETRDTRDKLGQCSCNRHTLGVASPMARGTTIGVCCNDGLRQNTKRCRERTQGAPALRHSWTNG